MALLLGSSLALIFIAAAWWYRRSDVVSFTFVLLAALMAAPLGWGFYAAVLVVPLAAVTPTLSFGWFVLPAFWAQWWYSSVGLGSEALSIVTLAAVSALTLILVREAARSRGVTAGSSTVADGSSG